jgi:hypothetical protein
MPAANDLSVRRCCEPKVIRATMAHCLMKSGGNEGEPSDSLR